MPVFDELDAQDEILRQLAKLVQTTRAKGYPAKYQDALLYQVQRILWLYGYKDWPGLSPDTSPQAPDPKL